MPLLRFSALLVAAVLVGCLYTWEQLRVSRLLDDLEGLAMARERAYQEGMQELQQLHGALARPAVENAGRKQGLVPLSAERLIILPLPPAPETGP